MLSEFMIAVHYFVNNQLPYSIDCDASVIKHMSDVCFQIQLMTYGHRLQKWKPRISLEYDIHKTLAQWTSNGAEITH